MVWEVPDEPAVSGAAGFQIPLDPVGPTDPEAAVPADAIFRIVGLASVGFPSPDAHRHGRPALVYPIEFYPFSATTLKIVLAFNPGNRTINRDRATCN